MADQGNPIDAMADIVRGTPDYRPSQRHLGPEAVNANAIGLTRGNRATSPANAPLDPNKIGFAHVRQALDEVEKRLQAAVLASEEVMRFHARAEPVNEAVQGQLPGDLTDATVWEDLATRAVLLSRSIESLERNLKITLETLR